MDSLFSFVSEINKCKTYFWEFEKNLRKIGKYFYEFFYARKCPFFIFVDFLVAKKHVQKRKKNKNSGNDDGNGGRKKVKYEKKGRKNARKAKVEEKKNSLMKSFKL